ncbi:hypothetical protein O1Q85_003808, partial [Aeromonas hydrophila]|nr:hypothetical protein [Aeromonas hydrophila]
EARSFERAFLLPDIQPFLHRIPCYSPFACSATGSVMLILCGSIWVSFGASLQPSVSISPPPLLANFLMVQQYGHSFC